ncbi:MAG: cobalamin biosynthesis protein CobW [Lachnospiraceae bacterium]|nr:cobalamin biosynthesis protein CobW [Lachnospiraceae bacterium]
MTKIDIVSGFLGAGKTTFIQKMLKEVLNKEKVVLIENEFGEIGIDGGFLKEAGIEIKEMNSGCICCSLVGDFGASLKEVIKTYSPERILIEPSGVGKLSDVIKAVADLEAKENMTDVALNAAVVVVDVSKCKMYIKNFGEFFINQVEAAGTIILSRTQNVSEEKLNEAVALLREHNAKATIITTPWDQLTGEQILKTYEAGKSLEEELLEEMKKEMAHSHGEECDDPECECHHHHHDDDDDDEDEHEHHHHHHHDDDDDDDDEDEHEHHHHHHHDGEECDDPECECHHHHDHDHHHHHHHADEVFTSIGFETAKSYTKEQINDILTKLDDNETYGIVLRSKGMVYDKDGGFIYFDYVPEEKNVRAGSPEVTGKVVVIGSKLNEEKIKELF